jgi:hypothetical protein
LASIKKVSLVRGAAGRLLDLAVMAARWQALFDSRDAVAFDIGDFGDADQNAVDDLVSFQSRAWTQDRHVEVVSELKTKQEIEAYLRSLGNVDVSRVVIRGKVELARMHGFDAAGRLLLSDELLLGAIRAGDNAVSGVSVVTGRPQGWLASLRIIPALGKVLEDVLHDAAEQRLTETNA